MKKKNIVIAVLFFLSSIYSTYSNAFYVGVCKTEVAFLYDYMMKLNNLYGGQQDVQDVIVWLKDHLNRQDISDTRLLEIAQLFSNETINNEQKIKYMLSIMKEDAAYRVILEKEALEKRKIWEEKEWQSLKQGLAITMGMFAAVAIGYPLVNAGSIYLEALVKAYLEKGYSKTGWN